MWADADIARLRTETETLHDKAEQVFASAHEKAERESQSIRDRAHAEIEAALSEVDLGNYDLILNRALGVVVMASDRVDITDQVIEEFDAAEAATSGE